MKPARLLLPIATFIMRIVVLLFIYINFFDTVLAIKFNQFSFYFASVMSIMGILFFIGTFTKKQTLTVFTSLVMFLMIFYKIFTISAGFLTFTMIGYLMFLSIIFFFLCNGNRK